MKIYDELDALIKKYQPDVMGVEKLFSIAMSRQPSPSGRPGASCC